MSKHILVTGGNSGIGLAMCKLLIRDHDSYVYLGSRSLERGQSALDGIKKEVPEKSDKIELVQIDVGDDNSCQEAAKALKAKGVKLYALVNNAGIGWSAGPEVIMNTNFYGPKRVTEAFLELIDSNGGRIVNVSSGAASMWLRHQDDQTKKLFSNPDVTFEELDKALQDNVAAKNFKMGGYGLSKAGLTALTMIHAKAHPNLVITSLSPGFIDTPMTKGAGAKLTPEQGCVSSIKCLFEDVKSGFYYGSDGLRSPMIMTRDPGMPEYEGEENPDYGKYNRGSSL